MGDAPVTRARRTNDLWLTEESSEGLRLSLKVTDVLHRDRTKWQDILVVDTPEYGRALMLDGAFQLTERDEFTYSEMMAHVPLCSHPDPKRVLIVGSGTGWGAIPAGVPGRPNGPLLPGHGNDPAPGGRGRLVGDIFFDHL